MFTRRTFVAATAAAALAPRIAGAQVRLQIPNPARTLIGFLWTQGADPTVPMWDAFVAGAGDADMSNGRDFTVQHVWCDDDDTKVAEYTQYLIGREVKLILAQGAVGAMAAAQATTSLPIIAPTMSQATAEFLIGPDFTKPKSNVTGMTLTSAELAGGQIELAVAIAPRKPVGILTALGSAGDEDFLRNAMAAATPAGIELRGAEVTAKDYAPAFASLVAQGVGSIIVPAPEIGEEQRKQIIGRAKAAKIPVVYGNRAAVQADGGLASLGGDPLVNYRRAGEMVGAILKGGKPGEIPMQKGAVGLVVNVKTARDQGITIPAAVLERATRVE